MSTRERQRHRKMWRRAHHASPLPFVVVNSTQAQRMANEWARMMGTWTIQFVPAGPNVPYTTEWPDET